MTEQNDKYIPQCMSEEEIENIPYFPYVVIEENIHPRLICQTCLIADNCLRALEKNINSHLKGKGSNERVRYISKPNSTN